MLLFGLKIYPRSIQFWLTCLVVACILPAAVGATVLLARSYQQERMNLEIARIGVARALMQVIDGELAGAASVLQVLARSPLIASGNFAAFQDEATYALTTTSGNNISLSQRDGGQIVNTMVPFGNPLPQQINIELQRHTFEVGKPVVSDVFTGPVIRRPAVAVQVPVIVDGVASYALTMAYFPERLIEILHRQRLPADWVVAIYDRKGIVAARTQGAERYVGKLGAAEAVRVVAKSTEGAFETLLLEGIPVQTVFSRSLTSGWAVVIAVPTTIATSGMRHSLTLNAAGAAVSLLLGAAMARAIARRISLSITALAVPALALGSGGPLTTSESGIVEVDTLRTVLLEAAHLIEQRVQERDAARDAERQMVIAADAADHANRAKSEFIASMTHELRTPLHGILGYAELLQRDGTLAPQQSDRVKVMIAAGEHLLRMINAVLDMSQIEANQMTLNPDTIELSGFASACFDVVRPEAEKKGLTLTPPPVAPLHLEADPLRLRQVLVNLLGNAVKFTATGTVELRLLQAASGAGVRLEVVDTGPGISPEGRHRLFKSFERLDINARQSVEGAGLGLAFSARLVTLMGGRIGYQDNPCGGSIFWLELPVDGVVAEVPQAPAGIPPPDAPAPRRALHVLVVDDVAMNIDIARAFLVGAGHRVTCADGGDAAVAAARETDFNVILMDVRMPGIDGLEATRRIRSLHGPRGRVPIVAVTAQTFSEQVTECRNAGMDSHLGKPFDQATLLSVVASAATAEPTGAAALPAAPAAASNARAADAAVPVVDSATYDKIVASFSPQAVASYRRSVAEQAEALLRDLQEPDAFSQSGDALAHSAHALSGSAGLLGFKRLSVIAKTFERAMQIGADDTARLADALTAAIEASLAELHPDATRSTGHAHGR